MCEKVTETHFVQVSLPRLQDFDWRIDLTSSSDHMRRMNLPSVIVQLKVRQLHHKTQSLHFNVFVEEYVFFFSV
jgi:hypothetical protein